MDTPMSTIDSPHDVLIVMGLLYHLLDGLLVVCLNTHIQPTHFLRAWICWCALVALSLYLLLPLCLSVCILWYDVYNAAAHLHRILILLSSHSVCTYVHPYLAPRIRAFPSLCMCTTHTYTHTYVCAPVYYTVHAPYHIHGTLPHLTRHHVRCQVYI